MVTDVSGMGARQISLNGSIAEERWFETERSNKHLQRIDFMKALRGAIARRFENDKSLLCLPFPSRTHSDLSLQAHDTLVQLFRTDFYVHLVYTV